MMQKLNKEKIIKKIKYHSEYSTDLEKDIKKTPEVELNTCLTKFAKNIQKMTREVYRDFERARQFTRTVEVKESLLCGLFYGDLIQRRRKKRRTMKCQI